jgi:hypothetical protein
MAGAGTVAIVAVVGLVAGCGRRSSSSVAVTDLSRNFKVCMLATSRTAPSVSGPAWNAIRDASERTAAVNAEQLTAPAGPPSGQVPYFGSLVSLKCRLIVVAGPELRAALTTAAKGNPAQQFLSYGAGAAGPNIRQVPVGDTQAITADIIAATKGMWRDGAVASAGSLLP